MPIVSVRDWDPSGTLKATPDENSGSTNVLEQLAGVIGLLKKRKQDSMDEAFRSAAAKAMQNGGDGSGADVSYEYDPAKKTFKYKVAPKKQDALGARVQRFVTSQQFGVDPVTGQPVQNPLKPKFGYSGDLLSQLLGGGGAASGPAPAGAPAASAGATDNGSPWLPAAQAATVAQAGIQMPSESGGSTQFLDPLDLEAQNAIAAGANAGKVKARLAALKAGGKRGGV